MKKIKVCYLHPWVTDIESMKRSLHIEDLPISENFEWDEVNPDYVFATEHVYSNPFDSEKFKRLSKTAAIRIFHACEAISPDLNVFDYAITFDKKLSDLDRIASLPSMMFFASHRKEDQENHISESEARAKLKHGLRFCNFLYSNRTAHPNRDRLFRALSDYKRVESLGRHLNNMNTLITCKGGGIMKQV